MIITPAPSVANSNAVSDVVAVSSDEHPLIVKLERNELVEEGTGEELLVERSWPLNTKKSN